MATSDCHKRKLGLMVKNLFVKLGKVIARAMCNTIRNTLKIINTFLQAQLVLLEPFAQLEDIFIENFLIFPADAIASSIGTVANHSEALGKFGIDNECKDHKKLNDAIKSRTKALNGAKRSLDSFVDQARKRQSSTRRIIEDLRAGIDTLTDMDDTLKCEEI